MSIELDFSGLFDRNEDKKQESNTKPPDDSKRPEMGHSESHSIPKGLGKIQEQNERIKETYKQQQDIIRLSQAARVELIKGVQAAENPYKLLLKAVECISTITGDKAFYAQIKGDLASIHGAALQTVMQEVQKEELQERLDKLEAAKKRISDANDLKRVNAAIAELQKRL